MLTVVLDKENPNIVNILQSYPYRGRIAKLPSARFNYDTKYWQMNRGCIDAFRQEFIGEVYYKTPIWYLMNRPAPDMTKKYNVEDVQLPQMKIQPYPYQIFGAKFMIDRIQKHGFVINSDCVGLGKTLQAIMTMQWYAEHKGIKKVLLIVKKAIKTQWLDEIKKFSTMADRYEMFYTGNTKAKREKAYKAAKEAEYSILVTNYHNFLTDTLDIAEIGCDFVIIDEAHCVKSKEGKINHNIGYAIKDVPTVFLTGTPVMSRPEDIFGIVQMSRPDYFGDFEEFSKRYLWTEYRYGYSAVIGVRHLDELREMVQAFVIRRTEYEISINMPETITKNIKVEPSHTQEILLRTITEHIKGMQQDYDDLMEMKRAGTFREDNENDVAMLTNRMKGMIAIKQAAATDPKILHTGKSKLTKEFAQGVPQSVAISPKTEAILDTTEEILDGGEKVILFSKFVSIGLYFKDIIEKKLKVNVLMFTGMEDEEARRININTFRDSDDYNVLIGSDAMAEGLNLAEARHVINIDIPDTYAIYQQRIGRVRRVSSEFNTICVHNIMTQGSVDEAKMEKIMKDKDLDGALIQADAAQAEILKRVSN